MKQPVQISPKIIEDISKNTGRYYVPENIKMAIENSFVSDDEDQVTNEYRRLFSLFQSYETKNKPIQVDYNGSITLDAYTAYYLCRNMFIPSIALRDLAFHPIFQTLPSNLKILDLGSGTGAVTLGLLSMFSKSPLSDISLEITAIDCCTEALDRQKDIINKAGYNLNQVQHQILDIRKTDDCLELSRTWSPYDFIFITNCLTEIPHDDAINLVKSLPDLLADKGALIVAEAQRNYTKSLIKSLTTNVRDKGLSVYYPCPTNNCPYSSWCWVWRYHEYDVPDIRVNGKELQENPKAELVANWLIVTNQGVSIYDPFRANRPDLIWGPVSKETDNDRSICCGNLSFKDKSFFPQYRRGHIVGLSNNNDIVLHQEI